MSNFEKWENSLDNKFLVDLVVHLACSLKVVEDMRDKLGEELDALEDVYGSLEDAESRPCVTLSRAAKELGLTRKKFEKWLVKEGFAYRDERGFAVPCSDDAFSLLEGLRDSKDGPVEGVLVRPYGMEAFRLMLDKQRKRKKK